MKESRISTDRFARGIVSGHWVNKKTGETLPFEPRHNQLTYRSADAMALAFAGNTARIPKYIGFIYGSSTNPTGIHSPSDRDLRWDSLSSEVQKIGGNILISQFSIPPTISVDDEESTDRTRYVGNAVTFHAHTRSGAAGTYAFPTDGTSYAGEFANGMTLYHGLLLGDDPDTGEKHTVPLARVSLAVNGEYRQKPTDYELALDWRVTFF
jgi:hypothetical protein